MDDYRAKLKESIKTMSGKSPSANIKWVTIETVDIDKGICDCKDLTTDLEYFELIFSLSDFKLVPKLGTKALIAVFNKSDGLVLFANEYDELVFKDGGLGGLVKINELKTQLDKNNQILTAILNVLTGAQIMEPGNGAPSALQIALSLALTGKIIADFSSIENEKITHGE